MDALNHRHIEGRGVPESAWRQSTWLASLPLRPLDELLLNIRRMVVVSPHPDDEVLGCGGLIYRARCAGIDVDLVSVTAGEACYPDHSGCGRKELGAVRAEELRRAAFELGVPCSSIHSLYFPDAAVAECELSLLSALKRLLHHGDRVLCTLACDGHPDHEATARAVHAASTSLLVKTCEFPIWMWHWAEPAGTEPQLQRAKRYALDDASWQAKQRAIACFTSQLIGPGDGDPILPPHIIERFMRREEVFSHVRD